jgi:hypothetical protein
MNELFNVDDAESSLLNSLIELAMPTIVMGMNALYSNNFNILVNIDLVFVDANASISSTTNTICFFPLLLILSNTPFNTYVTSTASI